MKEFRLEIEELEERIAPQAAAAAIAATAAVDNTTPVDGPAPGNAGPNFNSAVAGPIWLGRASGFLND